MAGREDLIRGYAQALFAVAEAEGVLDQVGDELFQFARAVEEHGDLRDALADRSLPAEQKKAVLADVLGKRASDHTLHLLGFVMEAGRARDLGAIAGRLVELAAERRQQAVAEVRTAVPLADAQRKKLHKALEQATGKTLELRMLVDPSVIGGVMARVGDQVFDGTIRRRLELAREHVIGA